MNYIGTIAGGRYQIIRKLSDGFLSTLYLARDIRETERVLAIKILERSRISTRIEDMIRFRTDITGIMNIKHPNLLTVHEVNDIETPYRYPVPYIVMDLIEGHSLEHIINNGIAIPLQKKIELMAQVSSALQPVHRLGILHRDIKPGNIIVSPRGAVLTDVGLARIKDFREYRTHGGLTHLFYYMSPEQCGTIGLPVDERSDLYSLGIVMYQLLTGSLPFSGDTISGIAHAHLTSIPAPPSSCNPEIPAICDSIILKLLEKEPEKRYQSALGLSADLEKILKGERSFIPGLKDTIVRLRYHTHFTGRHNELKKLLALQRDSVAGMGSLCLMDGDAGIGKTRLLDEFNSTLASHGQPCIALFESSGDRGSPYRSIRDLLGMYIQRFSGYSEKRKEQISSALTVSLGNPGYIILQINPGMKTVLGELAPPVPLTDKRETGRFLHTAGGFFRDLARAEGSLTILLDDIHDMDTGSLEILEEISSDIKNSPLQIVAAYRKGKLKQHSFFTGLIQHCQGNEPFYQHISLTPCTAVETKNLVEGILFESTPSTKEISTIVHSKSGGNPSFTIEILKQLIHERVVSFSETGWILHRTRLKSVEIPHTMVDIILNKISCLDTRERSVLSHCAVIGMRFSLSLLFQLLEKSSSAQNTANDEVVSIIDKAVSLGILSAENPQSGEMYFPHSRIHDAFYTSIDDDTRKHIHGELVKTIENLVGGNTNDHLYSLAYHAIGSDDKNRILQYAYPAALKLKNDYALDQSIAYLKKIIDACDDADNEPGANDTAVLLRFAGEELAFLYLITGEYDNAIRIYTSLIENTTNTLEKASLYRNISRAYFKKGDWVACEKTGAQGLELLGFTLPAKKISIWISIIFEFFRHIMPGEVKKIFITHDENRKRIFRHISWSYLDLGWSYILSDNIKFLMIALKVLNIAEYRLGPSRVMGMSLGGYGALLMSIPLFERSIRYLKRSLAVRKEQGDEWGYAQSLQWLGYCYEWKGDYRQSILCFNESLSIFNRIGDQREAGMCTAGLIHNYTFASEYSRIETLLREYRDITAATKDHYGISESYTYRIRCLVEQGHIERAIEEGELALDYSKQNNVSFTHCRACSELGMVYLEKNEPARALEYLNAAISMTGQHRYLKQYTVSTYTLYAECLIMLYQQSLSAPAENASSQPGLGEIRKACRLAVRHTRRWVSHYSAALRVYARYHDLAASRRSSEKYFMKAIEHANKLGQPFEEAKSRYFFARHLIRHKKNDLARFHLETAYTIFSKISAALYIQRIAELLGMRENESPSLAGILNEEKLAIVMKLSTELSAMSDVSAVILRAVQSAMELTGAGRCCILTMDDTTSELTNESVYNMEPTEISDQMNYILHYVFNNDVPLIIQDASRDSALQTILSSPSTLKGSILCMTIKVKEKNIGVFYMDNPLLTSVFNENDLTIMNLIFSHAALVLDKLPEAVKPSLLKDDKGKKTAIPDHTGKKIESVITYLHENYRRDISREGLADHLDINPDYLGKMFKVYTGKKIGEYINDLRIQEAARALRETEDNIIDIAFSVGYESLRTFNRLFLKVMGTSPKQYRDSYTR